MGGWVGGMWTHVCTHVIEVPKEAMDKVWSENFKEMMAQRWASKEAEAALHTK